MGIDDALPAGTVLNVGGSNGGGSRLYMEGFDATIAGLQIVGNNTRELVNNSASDSTLTLNVGNGENYDFGGNVAGSGTINLVKTGEGTQTFNRTVASGAFAANIGTIAVNDGELVWNVEGGEVDGLVSVGADGTLSGTGLALNSLDGVGIVDDATTVAGNLDAGFGGTGTLTFNDSLTLDATAITTLELAGTGVGQFDVLLNDLVGADVFTAGGALTLDASGYTAMDGDVFQVLENWDTFSGSFASITPTNLDSGFEFDTSNLLTTGQLSVVAIAVPEPSTAMLLAIGAGVIGVRRRKR